MADLFCSNLTELREVSVIALSNLTEAYVGVLRCKFIWITNEGGQDDNKTVIIPNSNPASGRWICPQAPSVPNQEVNKTNSSLEDLVTRSASHLNSGTLQSQRLPAGVPFISPMIPGRVLVTDGLGNFKLDTVDISQVTGQVPFNRLDWSDFQPNMIGAEFPIHFNTSYFDRDAENHVSIKMMTGNQPGLATPGTGIETDEYSRINVIYGTGDNEALEGSTPLEGDLSGTHGASMVNKLKNIPLGFNFNTVNGKNGWLLKINVENTNNPYFYLAPMVDEDNQMEIYLGRPAHNGEVLASNEDGTRYWTAITKESLGALGINDKAADSSKFDGYETSHFQTALGFTPLAYNAKAADSDKLDGHEATYFQAALGFTPLAANAQAVDSAKLGGQSPDHYQVALGFTPLAYNGTAVDSDKLGGQLPAYYQVALGFTPLAYNAQAVDSAKLEGHSASYFQPAIGYTPANDSTVVHSSEKGAASGVVPLETNSRFLNKYLPEIRF